MSSINNSAAAVPTESSDRNEYCISEQLLQKLAEDIDKKIVEGAHKTQSKYSTSTCIYRVPEEFRKLKESAYTPRFVSIGPLHCKDQHLLKSLVQDIKMSYANSLFRRTSGESEERKSMLVKECVGQMRNSLDEAKKCYAEEVEELNEEMLVIDGCFILELLYRNRNVEIKEGNNDPIFGSILMPVYVRHDLLLLENQLPFFVLKKLFQLTVAPILVGKQHRTLRQYVIAYFGRMWNSKYNESNKSIEEDEYLHILHILHNHYHHHDAVARKRCGVSKLMPCASDLEYAGVKFVVGKKVGFSKRKGPFPSSLFHRAYFEIPALRLYDSTEPLLRNLIAFEQCCCDAGVKQLKRYFTSYAFLMDTLINTPNDVQVLEKAEIIQNHLGASEDASNLFNNLCKGVVLGNFHFTEATGDAARYSKRFCSGNMADLKRRYFANPWTFLAFCAGFITFGITVFRFICGNFYW